MNAVRFMHRAAQGSDEALIARQSQHEADPVFLAPLHQRVAAKARIAPDVDSCARPVSANLPDNAFELLDAAGRGVLIRFAQPCAQQMLAAEDVQRQITVATVVAVKESTFLVTVQRVIGGIKIESDLARRLRMRFNKQLDQ